MSDPKEKAALEEQEAAEKAAVEKEMQDKALIGKACKAYGFSPKYLFACRIDGDDVVLVTDGGKRVRYAPGDKVERLDQISITGINPAAKKRKVIAGKAKK